MPSASQSRKAARSASVHKHLSAPKQRIVHVAILRRDVHVANDREPRMPRELVAHVGASRRRSQRSLYWYLSDSID